MAALARDDRITIGSELRRLRLLVALKQNELAEILEVTQQSVSQWERGIAMPSARQVPALERVFGVPGGYFDGLVAPRSVTRGNLRLVGASADRDESTIRKSPGADNGIDAILLAGASRIQANLPLSDGEQAIIQQALRIVESR
jgi:transcriptional regulator with XRE-family HTH domain